MESFLMITAQEISLKITKYIAMVIAELGLRTPVAQQCSKTL
jgi:hypothetical protein